MRAGVVLALASAVLTAAAPPGFTPLGKPPPAPPGFLSTQPPPAPPGFAQRGSTALELSPLPQPPGPPRDAPAAPPGFALAELAAPPPGFAPTLAVPVSALQLIAGASKPVAPTAAPPGFSPAAPAPANDHPAQAKAPVVFAPDNGPPALPVVGTANNPAAQATLGLEHEGRVDGAVLISDLGLALTTSRAMAHPTAPLSAALLDGRRVGARVLAVDPGRDLALVQLDGPGPYTALTLASGGPELGAPATAVVQPGALSWTQVFASVEQRYASHSGKTDAQRLLLRVATPVLGEGGPVVDSTGHLLGVIASPEPDQSPGEAVVIGVDAIRGFLDRAGVYAPGFALVVTASPSATVTVDGRPAGDTSHGPLRVEKLTLGRHEVKLAAQGMAEDVVSVELVGHAVESLNRALDPGGTLGVTASTRADVWVDGSLRGQAPTQLVLPAGRHVVDVRANGYLPATRWVEVATGKRADVDVSLERIAGELTLDTVPQGATVTANGEEIGKTPLAHARVPAGNVEVGIRFEGKHAYKFNVAVAPHETKDLGVYRLEDPFGWLDPVLPHDAAVVIDGGPRHVAQRYERLTVGPHTIDVFAPGYYAWSTQVTVADAQTVVLDPPLALYDRLPPRRAAGYGLTGLGAALGLVSIGFATDDSTKNFVAPGLLAGALALGVGAWCIISSSGQDQAGWTEQRTWTGPAPASTSTPPPTGAGGP
ncbi:MAG: PEGA domain-containing protein [Deltaproteobacteria bacterium]|nr:PEGA domain-containing protein [Deltaproteobacteria bacterium]